MRNRVKERLKTYKRDKAIIETVRGEINELDRIMGSREALESVINDQKEHKVEPGMPKANRVTSIVENEVEERERAIDMLKKRKKELENEVWPLQREVEQVDIALKALSEEQRFVIKERYFEKTGWGVIEYKFNETFGSEDEYISSGALRKRMDESVLIICEILKPFYDTRSKLAKTIGLWG